VANIIQPSLWICTSDFEPSLVSLAASDGYIHSSRVLFVDSATSSDWDSNLALGDEDERIFVKPHFDVIRDVVSLPFSSGTTGNAANWSFLITFLSIKIGD